MKEHTEEIFILEELFPNLSESELLSALEENRFDTSAAAESILLKYKDASNIDNNSLQLIEMFPDESIETLLQIVNKNPDKSLQELVCIYYDGIEEHSSSNSPTCSTGDDEIYDSGSEFSFSLNRTSKVGKQTQIYKTGIENLVELEYNLTGRVPSNFNHRSSNYVNPDQSTAINYESSENYNSLPILSVSVEDGLDPTFYRNLASQYFNNMTEKFKEASIVHSRLKSFGPCSAHYFSQEGYRYQRLMQEANRKAAFCIFKQR